MLLVSNYTAKKVGNAIKTPLAVVRLAYYE